jgi:hypothetical protein
MFRYFLVTIPILLCLSNSVQAGEASTFSTPKFSIKITENCEEGVVGCDNVTYVGVNKKTGKSITLKGKSLMRLCADRVTPCQHIGYTFQNGKVVYLVTDQGTLTISKGAKVLVKEEGTWSR